LYHLLRSKLTRLGGNDPSFWFSVTRRSSNDVLFSTKNTKIIYEDQFIEFKSSLPEDYNLYGLGEHIHGLRLSNNYTATLYAADVGDPIDFNLYSTHPFYLDTRYFERDRLGKRHYVKRSTLDQKRNGQGRRNYNGSTYESASHGVYLRNTHGQEVLLRSTSITWRALGGSIDLFFFDGPTQSEVTKQYQSSAIGLPAMQNYWGLGYHQCRWGYRNWTELREIVQTFKKFEIPLGMLISIIYLGTNSIANGYARNHMGRY